MDLKEQLKQYEGTKQYQARLKYFRNERFYPYADSLGKMTIGYGHLILPGENFTQGITEDQADALLDKDISIARSGVKGLNLQLPKESKWNDFLVIMVFQLGLTGVKGFKKFLAALSTGNYARAITECKDSLWYRQTPNRVDAMIQEVLRG